VGRDDESELRVQRWAQAFIDEVRHDLEQAAKLGVDLPPRVRAVFERAGHATPEYRTFAIPAFADLSPDTLSVLISRFTRERQPIALLLAVDASTSAADGAVASVLITEARDAACTRLFRMQAYRTAGARVVWDEPTHGGWHDPGEEEMILDAAFSELAVPAVPAM
jgi:hypothetical protein